MPTIYAETSDGIISSGIKPSFAGARDYTGLVTPSTSITDIAFACESLVFTGRGAAQYRVTRSFFNFDTSGISGTVSSATFKIVVQVTPSTFDFIVISADTAFTLLAFPPGQPCSTNTLGSQDFDNVDFSTPYSAKQTISTRGYGAGYVSVTLNSDALTAIKNNNCFKIAVVEHDSDYSNSAPSGAGQYMGILFSDYAGTTKDPALDYTLATGYGNDISGVAAANIGKVDGVATANIEKVIGV